MTIDLEAQRETRFVPAILPWVVAAAGLVLYLVTLSHWITATSLGSFARVAGYQWQPVLSNPLYFLLTLPLKQFPVSLLPVALNAFSAVCAALTLALLARSVALLPHDRTHLQRQCEPSIEGLLTIRAAWLPVVFAVLACGLNFMFWERATAGGPEMLDLLLFAYAVRCLLEYRRSGRDAWVLKGVCVYALGMTENWLLVFLLPVFVASLVWIMGFSFFNARFLGLALALALAGLAFYLVLPLWAKGHAETAVPFWPALKAVLAGQKTFIAFHWQHMQDRLILAAIPSLLPLFIMGLRFGTTFGDTSHIGKAVTTVIFHILQGAFLGFCTWVTLDPPFSAAQKGLGAQFLPAQFLAALGIGYFSGYFLLLFGPRAQVSGRWRDLMRRRNGAVVAGVWVLPVLVVGILVYRNLPLIHANNGEVLRGYATTLVRALPARPAVLLSDDPRRLWLAQAALASQPSAPKHLPVDTHLLVWPDYHRTLNRQSGGVWPLPPTNRPTQVDVITLMERMRQQTAQREVWYLHPSFGYYFEYLYPQPHGIAHRVAQYPTNTLFRPAMSSEVLQENSLFWSEMLTNEVACLTRCTSPRWDDSSTNFLHRVLNALRVTPGVFVDPLVAAGFHSRSINAWGVELQKLGRLKEAGEMFAAAGQLSPWNVVARINREFNRHLASGSKATVTITRAIEDQFGIYKNWEQVLTDNGPFDEPTFCYEQGTLFVRQSLYRQAIQEFERVRTLAPDDVASRLWLVKIYALSRLFEPALGIVDEIKAAPRRFALTATNRTDFLIHEADARFGLGGTNVNVADDLLQAAITREPTNAYLLAGGAQVYLRYGLYTNAVVLFDRQLRLDPGNTNSLMNRSTACLQSGAFKEAIPTLDRLLTLQPSNSFALFNRAIANLQAGQLAEAERDYRAVAKVFTNAYQVHFGLGEVAWRSKHTNDAIRYCQLYLSNAPPDTAEAATIRDRLRQLQPAKP
jgi:tetratricopeptide (TPR) repeat protein